MARITYIPNRVIDTNGIADGASVHVYQSGTTTPVSLFLDAELTDATTNPYVVAAGAPVPPLYTSYLSTLRLRVVSSDGSVPMDADPYETFVTNLDLSADTGWDQIGTEWDVPLGTVLQAQARPFETFTGMDTHDWEDPDADCSEAMVEAWEWSAAQSRPVLFSGRYRLANVAVLEGSGYFLFDGGEIYAADDGIMGVPMESTFTQVPMALHFRACENPLILGQGAIYGLNPVPGDTLLYGMWFDQCDGGVVGEFHLENLAEGQMFMCCNDMNIGDTTAELMYGQQGPVGGPYDGAGSAQVIAGCLRCTFGALWSLNNDKPMRYLSLGIHTDTGARDSTRCAFGPLTGTGRTGSPWAQGYGIRSARNCTFGPINVANVSMGVFLQKYASDNDYAVDGNLFVSLKALVINSAGSTDAGLNCGIENGAVDIGTNTFLEVDVSADDLPTLPAVYGVYANSGTIRINNLRIRGFTIQIYGYDCRFEIEAWRGRDMGTLPMRYGRSLTGYIRRATIPVGPQIANSAGVFRSIDEGEAATQPNFDVFELEYNQGGSAFACSYLLYDVESAAALFSLNSFRLHKVTGTGTIGQGLIGAVTPEWHDGYMALSSIPTFSDVEGAIVKHKTPAVGGTWGWLNRTGSTTWDPIGVIGMVQAAAPTVTYSLTYAAPSGGATQDAECRASLAQLAADAAELAADLADLRTKLAAAEVTA